MKINIRVAPSVVRIVGVCAGAVLISCSALLPFQAVSALPSLEKTKNASGKEVVTTFLSAFSHPKKAKSADAEFAEASKLMDFNEMVRRSFGDADWDKFTDAEKKEFSSLFKKLIQIRYYPRWSRIFRSGQFDSKSEAKSGKDVVVNGTLKLDGKISQMTFRLARETDGLRLVSMAIDEKDLLDRTSVKLKRGLARKGVKGLILHLRKKISDDPKELKDKSEIDDLVSGKK